MSVKKSGEFMLIVLLIRSNGFASLFSHNPFRVCNEKRKIE